MAWRSSLALIVLVAGGAAEAQMRQPDRQPGTPPRCDGPEFACALEATPTFAGDGSLWLVWASASRVYTARSGNEGRSFTTPVEITRSAAKLDHSADTRPQVVIDNSGGITVGYAVNTDVAFQGEILLVHSADGGRSFPPPRPLDASRAGKRFLSLAVDPGGKVLATWVDKRDLAAAKAAGREYAGAAVFAAWSRDGGATFGEPVTVREHTCECCRVAVDFAGQGRPVVLWRNLFGKARDHAITTFSATGAVGPVYRLSDDDWEIDACPHHGPDVAVAADGSYHVTWFTASDRRRGLFYARSRDGGATFSPPQPIGDPARQPARPRLLAVGDDLWLAWREYDGTATEVLVMRSQNGGKDWTPRRVVGRSTGTADHPLLVHNASRVFVSWLTRAEGYRLMPLDAGVASVATTSLIATSGAP